MWLLGSGNERGRMEWWSRTTTNCYETWTDLVQGELRQVTASLWTSVSSAIKWGLDEVSKLWQGKTVTIFLADLHFLLTQKKWSTFILKLSLTFEIPSLLFLTLIKKFFLLKFWSLPFFPLTSSLFLPPIHCPTTNSLSRTNQLPGPRFDLWSGN